MAKDKAPKPVTDKERRKAAREAAKKPRPLSREKPIGGHTDDAEARDAAIQRAKNSGVNGQNLGGRGRRARSGW